MAFFNILGDKNPTVGTIYDGGIVDPILSIWVWASMIAGAYYLLKRNQNLCAYCLLLTSLAIISFAFREYQISVSCSYAKYNMGFDPQDFLIDLWFVHRGSAIRFAAISCGLLLATACRILKKPDPVDL
ncbi:hypothetical protein N9294_01835 [bacterium]|nr:hypothetical protein [Akkermansiaceae bacterium]MDB4422683.1 hypothetical protein [bacterium]